MRFGKFRITAIAVAAVALANSCSPRAGSEAAAARIAAGPLMSPNITFSFALYYLPVPDGDPLAVLAAFLKNRFNNIQQVSKIGSNAVGIVVHSQVLTNAQETHPPPSLDSLTYFGKGLTREQAVALQSSKTLLLLQFAYQSNHVWSGMKPALELTEALARQTKGIIWDVETRQAFSVETWQSERLETWSDTVPDISKHVTMHAYNKGEYTRAITLGMRKFGLPDIVVDNFSWSETRPIGNLINVFAQAVAEGAVITKAGEFDLDLRNIKAREVRDPQLQTLKPNATGMAKLTLHKGEWEEGDPENRLIAIGFDRYRGRDVHARQTKLLSTMFGWEDSVTPTRHDEEILLASQRARAKLPELRVAFKKGLAPGEYIQVKAPFAVPGGGNEWMWVEITAWQGGKIKGLLKNEPLHIPNLHGGQIVEVEEAKVFDYSRTFADGRQEGNETGAIIEHQSKSRR